MTSNQLNNLLNFTLLLHKVHTDGYFLQQSPDYILEKYDKMIGFDPLSPCDMSKFHVSMRDNYLKRWYLKRPSTKLLSILNYFFEIHSKPFSVDSVVDAFAIHIGNMGLINNEVYTHLHPLLIKFIDKTKTLHQREINLELLS
jgi:hypothetical protein